MRRKRTLAVAGMVGSLAVVTGCGAAVSAQGGADTGTTTSTVDDTSDTSSTGSTSSTSDSGASLSSGSGSSTHASTQGS